MRLFTAILLMVIVPLSISADPIPNEMALVPHGIFIMGDGDPSTYCGYFEREVTLTRSFYLGQHEVTNREYLEAVQWAYDQGYVYVIEPLTSLRDNLDGSTEELLDLDDEHCEIQFDGEGSFYLRESPSSDAQNAYPDGYDPRDHPVKEVTWYGAVRYCDWLSLQLELPRAYEHMGDWSCNGGDPYGAEGYRLPTDAEWEYAAQWDDERVYPWGDETWDCSLANFYDHDGSGDPCIGWTSPVGSYPDAPEALGLSDMAGNMWEWCNDWFVCNSPDTSPVTDPTGPENGTYRVFRGGSWRTGGWDLRCSYRIGAVPQSDIEDYGFRVARTVPPGADVGASRPHPKLYLDVNHPNPFTGMTQITYSVPPGSAGTFAIYDASGRLVRTLALEQLGGEDSVLWDGSNDAGEAVEAGAYFYRLTVGNTSISRQMLLLK